MTKHVPVLSFINNAAGGAVAIVSLDSTIDQVWILSLDGSDGAGSYVRPTHLIIDNTGINSAVYIYDGQFTTSVSPYTRKTFPLPNDLSYLRITVSSGAVPALVFNYDPKIPDEVNDVASGIASGGSGTVTTYATLDSALSHATITLSGANLIAQATAGAPWRSAVVDINKSGGKFYFEGQYLIGTAAMIGVAGAGYTNTSYLASVDGAAWRFDLSGNSVINGVNGVAIAVPSVGGYVGVAVDLTAKQIWYRIIGSNWNNDAAADPATGANPIGIAATTAPYRAAVSVIDGSKISLNFGASPFQGVAPSGFGSWGT